MHRSLTRIGPRSGWLVGLRPRPWHLLKTPSPSRFRQCRLMRLSSVGTPGFQATAQRGQRRDGRTARRPKNPVSVANACAPLRMRLARRRRQHLSRLSSEKNVSGEEVNARPFSPGQPEALEVVPGPDHHPAQRRRQGPTSISCAASTLDHGTDLAISVDDMPVNMRTHAHGQGYADLNFLIPRN